MKKKTKNTIKGIFLNLAWASLMFLLFFIFLGGLNGKPSLTQEGMIIFPLFIAIISFFLAYLAWGEYK